MIYQLRANLYFAHRDSIVDIMDKIEDCFDDTTFINAEAPNAEFSTVEVIENHHDEDPLADCILLTKLTNQPDEI